MTIFQWMALDWYKSICKEKSQNFSFRLASSELSANSTDVGNIFLITSKTILAESIYWEWTDKRIHPPLSSLLFIGERECDLLNTDSCLAKQSEGVFNPYRHECRNNQNKLNWFDVFLVINNDQELYKKTQKGVSITE